MATLQRNDTSAQALMRPSSAAITDSVLSVRATAAPSAHNKTVSLRSIDMIISGSSVVLRRAHCRADLLNNRLTHGPVPTPPVGYAALHHQRRYPLPNPFQVKRNRHHQDRGATALQS